MFEPPIALDLAFLSWLLWSSLGDASPIYLFCSSIVCSWVISIWISPRSNRPLLYSSSIPHWKSQPCSHTWRPMRYESTFTSASINKKNGVWFTFLSWFLLPSPSYLFFLLCINHSKLRAPDGSINIP